jgi:hypothetical protein
MTDDAQDRLSGGNARGDLLGNGQSYVTVTLVINSLHDDTIPPQPSLGIDFGCPEPGASQHGLAGVRLKAAEGNSYIDNYVPFGRLRRRVGSAARRDKQREYQNQGKQNIVSSFSHKSLRKILAEDEAATWDTF